MRKEEPLFLHRLGKNILRVKLGLSLTVGLEQGRPHLVLEGPFSTKFSSSPNEKHI